MKENHNITKITFGELWPNCEDGERDIPVVFETWTDKDGRHFSYNIEWETHVSPDFHTKPNINAVELRGITYQFVGAAPRIADALNSFVASKEEAEEYIKILEEE